MSGVSFNGTYVLPLNQFPKSQESKQKINNLGRETAECIDLEKENGVKDGNLVINVKPEQEAKFENIVANYGLNINKVG